MNQPKPLEFKKIKKDFCDNFCKCKKDNHVWNCVECCPFIGLELNIKSSVEWLEQIYFKLDNHIKPWFCDTQIKELMNEYKKNYIINVDKINYVDINNFKRWLLKKAFNM